MKNLKRNTKNPFWYFFTLFSFLFGFVAYIIIKQSRESKKIQRNFNPKPNKDSAPERIVVNKKPLLTVKKGMTKRQEQIYEDLVRKGKLYPTDLAKLLPEVSSRTIRRDMTKLVELGLVNQKGTTKSTYYILAK